jgi:outer membrane protein assembly factor BamA
MFNRLPCDVAAALVLAAITTAASAAPPASTAGKHADAKAGPVYHLLGFSLSGSKRIDPDAIIATLPQHEGDPITRDQIKQDADQVRAILKKRHIHGDMTTAILEQEGKKGHQIWVIWDIQLTDPLSFVPLRHPRHFASQTFTGNTALTTDQLTAIAGLHAGDLMRDGKLSDVRTTIEQAYDKALPGKDVTVKGKVKLKKDDTIVIDWQITEPK